MSWQTILKSEDALKEWMEEWQLAKQKLDEEFIEKYEAIRESLLDDAPKAHQSSKNLRRKHPHTGRKRQPVELSNRERERAELEVDENE